MNEKNKLPECANAPGGGFTAEEIAKSLKVCTSSDAGCDGCIFAGTGSEGCDALMKAASDAIADLTKKNMALEESLGKALRGFGQANAQVGRVLARSAEFEKLAQAQDTCLALLRSTIEEKDERIGSLEEELRWIPVTEQLPEAPEGADALPESAVIVSNEYLVMIDGAEKPTCLYWDGKDFFDIQGDELIPYRVTHWKPMPKGPEVAG